MKKILLLGAMLIGSLCMNAQTLLVAGNGGEDPTGTWLGGKNWDTNVTDNPNIMTDGSITLNAPAGTWVFKVVSVPAEVFCCNNLIFGLSISFSNVKIYLEFVFC